MFSFDFWISGPSEQNSFFFYVAIDFFFLSEMTKFKEGRQVYCRRSLYFQRIFFLFFLSFFLLLTIALSTRKPRRTTTNPHKERENLDGHPLGGDVQHTIALSQLRLSPSACLR